MNLYQIGAWIELHDPRRYMTRVQHEVIVSALMRDDTDKAKKMLADWKIPQEPYEPR